MKKNDKRKRAFAKIDRKQTRVLMHKCHLVEFKAKNGTTINKIQIDSVFDYLYRENL